MARGNSLNSFELNCTDAFFALIVEALRAHMLRTRRIQTLRTLIDFCLIERLWKHVPLDESDIYRAARLATPGDIRLYLTLSAPSAELLRVAKADLSEIAANSYSSFEVMACLLRLSLEIPGNDWAA